MRRVGIPWALAAAIALASGPAPACGLEDPADISSRRGSLQIAYPEALHVGTAVWQAQLAGTLPRDPFARRADLSPEARAAQRLARAKAVLGQFASRLKAAPDPGERPGVAIVLLGPVLWTRLEREDGAVTTRFHVDGPETGDVVAVTELAVIEALARGRLGLAGAVDGGLLRLYGPPGKVAAAYAWLAAATPGKPHPRA